MNSWPHCDPALFDPRKVPLSVADSFLCVSWLEQHQGFWIRNLRGGDEGTDHGRLLRLAIPDEFSGDANLAPDCLSFGRHGVGRFALAFHDAERIVIRSERSPIVLETAGGKYDYLQSAGSFAQLCIARQDLQCAIAVRGGTLTCRSGWDGLSAGPAVIEIVPHHGAAEVVLRFYRVEAAQTGDADFQSARRRSGDAFREWLKGWPALPDDAGAKADLLALYVLWANRVPAEGALSLPAVYMSKNVMTNIWSWDHCFVALALVLRDSAGAFDQMAVVFAAQHSSGRLPDFINNRFSYWAFTKPPVHGWTFGYLRRAAPHYFDRAVCARVVQWLKAQAESWFAGPAYNGLPTYRHGNDGGWDNATAFLRGGPVASPDLVTFLILQLEEIAALHALLGSVDAADVARGHAQSLQAALIENLWVGDRFVTRLQATGEIVADGDSLVAFLPLMLGPRLPPDCRARLIAALKQSGRFLTAHGLATEALTSPFYKPDGYWRGPIWAPVTALFVDALDASGEHDFADDLAQRFCAMAQASGMAENFDSVTGEGLCDSAFAWTAAVYLSLRYKLARRNPGSH